MDRTLFDAPVAFALQRNEAKASSPWKIVPIEELMTRDPRLIESGLMGHFSNLCRLESILALVT
jgi:hypothetical protein